MGCIYNEVFLLQMNNRGKMQNLTECIWSLSRSFIGDFMEVFIQGHGLPLTRLHIHGAMSSKTFYRQELLTGAEGTLVFGFVFVVLCVCNNFLTFRNKNETRDPEP